jgi:hypothetical protein
MSDVPKIVLDRLRAGAPDGGHPDPDVLTAFAEQALSPAERESVLQHLAQCGDCREVSAVALPASESVLVPQVAPEAEEVAVTPVRQEKTRRNWFGWHGLRWAAATAAVVVVASVLMLRPGKPSQPTVAGVINPAENKAAETTASQPAAPSADQFSLSGSVKSEEGQIRKADAARAEAKSKLLTPSKAVRERTDLAKLEPGVARPEALKDSKRAYLDAANIPAAAPPPPARAEAVTVGAASETVEVTSAAGPVETSSSTTNENLGLMRRNMQSLPIEKAKPPVQGQEERLATAVRTKKQALGASSNYALAAGNALQPAPAANWRLSEGALERSLSAGLSWQTVLRSDHSLLCHAVRGNDIWAGGQAGTLFHSTDGGTTWTQLHPAVKDQQLTADITGIELQKPGEAALTTGNSESWTTTDNGKTWTKK